MYVTAAQADRLWARYGEWVDSPDYDRAHSKEALAALDPWLMYPEGGRRPLWLGGWDGRSVWGFDPQLDAYFAQLWRNADVGDGDAPPDIWILGRGTCNGQPYAVSSARVLAHEIAMATGAELTAVCKAILGTD